ncbi:MAG: ABC transporter substrate-binding protein [Armatimonadota bacterium]|nr:ABC transporter substrate-binding protein [Armatimonadota bacterium]MDR7548354.1 ABC transporter substrate-binding protein [Armatimonadota bacterium]
MRIQVWLLAVLLMVTTASPSLGQVTVRIYNCMHASEDMNKRLEAKFGVLTALWRGSCGEMWARIQAESREGRDPTGIQADLIFSVLPDQFLIGKTQGLWVPYPNSRGWTGVDRVYIDPDGQGYNVGTFSWLIYGHEPRLKEKRFGMPKSVRDLLDPKWKGEILLPSPITSGTAYLIVVSVLSLMGEERGWKFLEDLDKNVAYYTRGGGAPAQLVARGEHLLGLATDEDALPLKSRGAPILIGVPDEGIGAIGQYVVIPKSARTLEVSKAIVDYVGALDFQEFLAGYGYLTARAVKNPLYPTRPKLIPIEWSRYGTREVRTQLLNTWREKFGHKARTS